MKFGNLLTVLVATVQLANAGIVFISGDDSDDSGHCQTSFTCGGLMGTLFEEAYTGSSINLPSIDILAIGVNSGSAFSSFNNYIDGLENDLVLVPGSLNIVYANTLVDINSYMQPSSLLNTALIYLPSSNSHTDGGITDEQIDNFTLEQGNLLNYVDNQGGSLFTLAQKDDKYDWLPFSVTTSDSCRKNMNPTSELSAFLPSLTNIELSHHCYHTYFDETNFGSDLYCLVRSNDNDQHCYMFGGENVKLDPFSCDNKENGHQECIDETSFYTCSWDLAVLQPIAPGAKCCNWESANRIFQVNEDDSCPEL